MCFVLGKNTLLPVVTNEKPPLLYMSSLRQTSCDPPQANDIPSAQKTLLSLQTWDRNILWLHMSSRNLLSFRIY